MKPTSIIFLILAAILIVTGIVVCLVSGSIARSNNTDLLCDKIDADGNAVTEESFDDASIKTVEISMEDVHVNIIGKSDRSYIEFKNINPVKYQWKIANGKLTVDTVSPFDISFSFLKEKGSGMVGLRNYLHLNAYENKTAEVNIYFAGDKSISQLSANVKNGDVTLRNATFNCAYDLKTENGNITLENVKTERESVINTKKGNLTCTNCSLKAIGKDSDGKKNSVIENGNVVFTTSEPYQYDVKCIAGHVILDGEIKDNAWHGLYPEGYVFDTQDSEEDEQTENTEDEKGEKLPGAVDLTVKNGDFSLTFQSAE